VARRRYERALAIFSPEPVVGVGDFQVATSGGFWVAVRGLILDMYVAFIYIVVQMDNA